MTKFGIYTEDRVSGWTAQQHADFFKAQKLQVWVTTNIESSVDVGQQATDIAFWTAFAAACIAIEWPIEVHFGLSPHYGWDEDDAEGWWAFIETYVAAFAPYSFMMRGWFLYVPEWFGNLKWGADSANEWEANWARYTTSEHEEYGYQRFLDLIHNYNGTVVQHINWLGLGWGNTYGPSDHYHNPQTWPFLDECDCADPCFPATWTASCIAETMVGWADFSATDRYMISGGMWEQGVSDPDHPESDGVHVWDAEHTQWAINGVYQYLPDLAYFLFTVYADPCLPDNEEWAQTCAALIVPEGTEIPLTCSDYTSQTACEQVGCYWYSDACHSVPQGEEPVPTATFCAWIDGPDTGSGYTVFYTNADVFDRISLCRYEVDSAPDYGVVVRGDFGGGSLFTDFLSFCSTHSIPVIATIGCGSYADRAKVLLSMDTYRTQNIASIVAVVQANGYAGIDLNYECLLEEDKALFSAYVSDLADALHGIGAILIVTLCGKVDASGTWGCTMSQDQEAIGNVADYVRVMCYGAIESLPIAQIREYIEYTLTKVDARQVVLANPFFDSGPGHTAELCDLVLEYHLSGMCAWTISYGQSEPGDFTVIREKFPTVPAQEPTCSDYTTQPSCELAGCYWYGDACHATPEEDEEPEIPTHVDAMVHYTIPKKKVVVHRGTSNYDISNYVAVTDIGMVENAVRVANLVIANTGNIIYQGRMQAGDLVDIFVNYEEVNDPLDDTDLRFYGSVEDMSPVYTETGQFLNVRLRGYGRCLLDLPVGQEYGSESVNDDHEELHEILQGEGASPVGLFDDYVNHLLGSTASTGYDVDDTYIEPDTDKINYVYFTYRPAKDCIDDLLDMFQAKQGASTAGFHWIVIPEKSGSTYTNYFCLAQVGDHKAGPPDVASKWPTYWNTTQAASTIVVRRDMVIQNFTQQRQAANYILYAGTLRKPGDGDKWTENNSGDWSVTGNGAGHTVTDENTIVIKNDYSIEITTGVNGDWVKAKYPDAGGMAWNIAAWGGKHNIPTFEFDIQVDPNVQRTAESTPLVRFHTAAADYYEYTIGSYLPSDDKWYHVSIPIGDYAAQHATAQDVVALKGGNGDWANINWIEIEAESVVQPQPGYFYVDGMHFSGHVQRGAKKARVSTDEDVDGAVADDGGVQTDETTAATNTTTNDMTLLPAVPVVNDAYYFGNAVMFKGVSINVGTAGAGNWTITWEYWNGAWTALSGVTDDTTGFTVAGTNNVYWTMPTDWAETAVDGTTLHWVRGRVSAFVAVVTQPLGTQAWLYYPDEPFYKIKVITDDIGKDDSGKASDDGYTMAQLAYAELLRTARRAITGKIVIPGKPTILPGQLAHIHAAAYSGGYRIDKDMRIIEHHLQFTEQGLLSYLTLTDDTLNSRPADPFYLLYNKEQRFDRLVADRQSGSIMGRTIDYTQPILEYRYEFSEDY